MKRIRRASLWHWTMTQTRAKGSVPSRLQCQMLSASNLSCLQVILLGDSAVGKSKLVERFLLDGYAPQQLSTYALTLYRWNIKKRNHEMQIVKCTQLGTGQRWELGTC